jgi:hypothetical protein
MMDLTNLKAATRIFNTSYLTLKALFDQGVQSQNQELILQSIPMTMILSFNIEISLKHLIKRDVGIQEGGHNLYILFNKLDDSLKHKITEAIKDELSINEDLFDGRLESIKNTFVDWRYFYEGDRNIDLEFLQVMNENLQREI